MFPVLLLAGVLAGPAMAQTAPAAASPPAMAAEPAPAANAVPASLSAGQPSNPDDVVVCRYEREPGTLFTTRLCHTMRQWKRMTHDAYDALDKLDSGKNNTLFQ